MLNAAAVEQVENKKVSPNDYPFYKRSIILPFLSSFRVWDDMHGPVDGPISLKESIVHSYLGVVLLLGWPILNEKKDKQRYKIGN